MKKSNKSDNQYVGILKKKKTKKQQYANEIKEYNIIRWIIKVCYRDGLC